MIEFTISFRYHDIDHNATVLRSETGPRTDYVVRPIDPSIVLKFGKQTLIFKENDNYNCGNHIDDEFLNYVDSLVNAIRDQETVSGMTT